MSLMEWKKLRAMHYRERFQPRSDKALRACHNFLFAFHSRDEAKKCQDNQEVANFLSHLMFPISFSASSFLDFKLLFFPSFLMHD